MSGSGARIIIRGGGSIIAGSDPVVYLDGVRIAADPSRTGGGGQSLVGNLDPLQMGRLEDLTPNEIERVDVLPGNQAAAQRRNTASTHGMASSSLPRGVPAQGHHTGVPTRKTVS